jgi:hypothetical protein
MKIQYVRGEMIDTHIIRGTVTRMDGGRGIVKFDRNGSAYFNLFDGCHACLGEHDLDKAIKFASAVDISRPEPFGQVEKRRIVCYLARDNNWAYVWAYESEFDQARRQLAEWNAQQKEERERAEKQRLVEREKEDREEKERLADLQRQEEIKLMAQQEIIALGKFRIAKAHKFTEETKPRPTKPATGPMNLYDLILAILRGQVKFKKTSQNGLNDTLHMWLEQERDGVWTRVELSHSDEMLIVDAYDGVCDIDTVQPVLERLALKKQEAVLA